MPGPRRTEIVPHQAPDLAQYRPRPALARNPAATYLASLAEGSRASQRSALRTLARIAGGGVASDPLDLPWSQLRYEHTQAIRAKLVSQYAHTTANRHLSALRGVLRQAWRLSLMSAEDYQRAVDLKPVRGFRELAGRALDESEIGDLFAELWTRKDPIGVRDEAILGVFFGGGLRCKEVTSAQVEGYDSKKRFLRVVGKGNKERAVFLPLRACQLLDAWLRIRGMEPGPVFRRAARTGITKAPLSVGGVALIVRRHRDAAHIKGMTTHDARRTYISDAIDRTGDLAAVARQVGHASVATTARYDRRGDKAKQRVAETVQLPEQDD